MLKSWIIPAGLGAPLSPLELASLPMRVSTTRNGSYLEAYLGFGCRV